MPLHSKRKQLVALLLLVFVIVIFCTSIVTGQIGPPGDIERKLEGITAEEKKVLLTLFSLTQEIEAMEKTEKRLEAEMVEIDEEIHQLEDAITAEELTYKKKQQGLEQVLKSYQRMGPGSYLEILMKSDSLPSFLSRINILRDLTRNTGELLAALEQSKEKLTAEKSKLTESLQRLQLKQKQSAEAIASKQKLKQEQEQYLASLKEHKEYYQEYLNNIRAVWDELKPLFSTTTQQFANIIQTGGIPASAVKISFSLFAAKASIDQKSFNEALAARPELPKLSFSFHEGKAEITLPEKHLTLSGQFAVRDGSQVVFLVQEGSFYEMPLHMESIQELFEQGEILLDFKSILGKYRIQTVELHEGSLQLTVK